MALTLKELGVLAMVGWCLEAGMVSAQAPVPREPIPAPPVRTEAIPAPTSTASAAPAMQYVPVVPPYAGSVGPQPGVIAPPPPPPPARGPLHRLLNSHGMACASNFQALGCGNFYSEFAFVFGSCRTFFAQPCLPSQGHAGNGPDGRGGYGRPGCCGY